MSKTDRLSKWKQDLDAWAIPDEIVAAAPESPWGFPPGLFERRASSALQRPPTAANQKALEALPEGGTVLDVGCGGGAASLPLAVKAGLIIAVDGSGQMLEGFRRAASALDVPTETIEGTWPDIARRIPAADVVVCNHVFYNVGHLGPFARELNDHARCRVVAEMTPEHPLAWMSDLWLAFHGLRRPEGPTYQDAAACLRTMGYQVGVRVESGPSVMTGFATREEALAFIRKRMCLRPEQDEQLAGALGERLRQTESGWTASPLEHRIATLWWDTSIR